MTGRTGSRDLVSSFLRLSCFKASILALASLYSARMTFGRTLVWSAEAKRLLVAFLAFTIASYSDFIVLKVSSADS